MYNKKVNIEKEKELEMQTILENRGGGAPENKLLRGNFLGFALELLRFKKHILPCHLLSGALLISKKNEQKILCFAQNDEKCAFTLAEVLITLGVIGIVAAMTLPSLISNWRYKQLETAFKKAYSVHSAALSLVKAEVGVDNLKAEFAKYDRVSQSYSRANEFISLYNDKLHVIGKCVYNEKIRNYNNTDDAYVDIGTTKIDYMLPDGSCYKAVVNGAEVSITIDINGAGAKPNRLGHDIFVFRVDTNGMLSPVKMSKLYTDEELEDKWSGQPAMSAQVGDPCSIKSKQKGNGMGCAWYALNDINPDDNSKRYWENLPK